MEGAPKLTGNEVAEKLSKPNKHMLFLQTNKLIRNSHFVLENSPVLFSKTHSVRIYDPLVYSM